jgi:hypothetical protein
LAKTGEPAMEWGEAGFSKFQIPNFEREHASPPSFALHRPPANSAIHTPDQSARSQTRMPGRGRGRGRGSTRPAAAEALLLAGFDAVGSGCAEASAGPARTPLATPGQFADADHPGSTPTAAEPAEAKAATDVRAASEKSNAATDARGARREKIKANPSVGKAAAKGAESAAAADRSDWRSRALRADDRPSLWWRTLDGCDPISLEPVAELEYPPFELMKVAGALPASASPAPAPAVGPAPSTWYDGAVLAHYITSTGVFLDPMTRQPLTRATCQRLDNYLAENRLRPLNVTSAFDVSQMLRRKKGGKRGRAGRGGGETGADVSRRREATVVLHSLFEFKRYRENGLAAAQQRKWDPTAAKAAGRPHGSAQSSGFRYRRAEAVVGAREGRSRLVDDDDWVAEGAGGDVEFSRPGDREHGRAVRRALQSEAHFPSLPSRPGSAESAAAAAAADAAAADAESAAAEAQAEAAQAETAEAEAEAEGEEDRGGDADCETDSDEAARRAAAEEAESAARTRAKLAATGERMRRTQLAREEHRRRAEKKERSRRRKAETKEYWRKRRKQQAEKRRRGKLGLETPEIRNSGDGAGGSGRIAKFQIPRDAAGARTSVPPWAAVLAVLVVVFAAHIAAL